MSNSNDELQNLFEKLRIKSLKRIFEVIVLVLAFLNVALGLAHFFSLPMDYKLLMVGVTEGAALVCFLAWYLVRYRDLPGPALLALETTVYSLVGAIVCLHLLLGGRPELATNLALCVIGFGIFAHSTVFVVAANVVFIGLVVVLRSQAALPGGWDHMIFHLLQASVLSLTAFFVRRRVVYAGAKSKLRVARSERDLREANIKLSRSMNDSMIALRRAEKAMKAKSDFLAAISHEIRTPMNGIRVASNLLSEDPSLEGEKRRLAEVVQSSADVLTTILNDILDMSKIESGKLELNLKAFDLGKFLQSIDQMWRLPMVEKGLTFTVTSNIEAPLWLMGDEMRIRQILFNLLSNALKFTDAGSVAVEVDVVQNSSGDYRIDLMVRDTGIGIGAAYLDDLFTPFSQEHAAIASEFGGTGLGLAICNELTSLMSGTLKVVSKPGEGAAFTLQLTLPKSSTEPVQETRGQDRLRCGDKPVFRDLKILVAEDNKLNQELIGLLFKKLGREICIVENGALALKACIEERYDVVFLDIKMPIMDGHACARAIRAQIPDDQQPFLVALSANAMDMDVASSLAAGMDRHLAKPIDSAELQQCLEAIEGGLLGELPRDALKGS